jgi:hypothetical protein
VHNLETLLDLAKALSGPMIRHQEKRAWR